MCPYVIALKVCELYCNEKRACSRFTPPLVNVVKVTTCNIKFSTLQVNYRKMYESVHISKLSRRPTSAIKSLEIFNEQC